MSKLAQAVQRGVDEMRTEETKKDKRDRRPRAPRSQSNDDEGSSDQPAAGDAPPPEIETETEDAAVVGDELANAETEGADMANNNKTAGHARKTKNNKKKSMAKKTSARSQKPAAETRGAKVTVESVVAAAPLRMVPGQVRGGDKNQYINIDFKGVGQEVMTIRLYPIGFGTEDKVREVRDLLVEFFEKHLQ